MTKWRIGCSGFSYKEWKEVFYPIGISQNKWFEYYCTKFDTLEINSTFYSFPRVSTLKNWYNRSPDEFRFIIKAPQTFTHYRRFNECDELLKKFYDTVLEGMDQKLGGILFQLPPSCKFSEEMLDKIILALDKNFKNIIEFRNISWWDEKVYKKLAENNITFSGVSHNKMPADIINNHALLYYRLHGVPVMFKSQYSLEELKNIIENILPVKADEVYIMFNNTWGTAGVINALEIKSLLIEVN